MICAAHTHTVLTSSTRLDARYRAEKRAAAGLIIQPIDTDHLGGLLHETAVTGDDLMYRELYRVVKEGTRLVLHLEPRKYSAAYLKQLWEGCRCRNTGSELCGKWLRALLRDRGAHNADWQGTQWEQKLRARLLGDEMILQRGILLGSRLSHSSFTASTNRPSES